VPLLLSTRKVGYKKKGKKGAVLSAHPDEVLKSNLLPDATERMQPGVRVMEVMEVD
jgi:hypothetical protein